MRFRNGWRPPALFVHGVLVNGYLFRPQLTELSNKRRCIAIDLMGHGLTEIVSDQDVSFDAQAAMLAQFYALGIDEIDLVANDSVGVSLIFAAHNPARLCSLTLTNGDVHDNWPPKDFSGFLNMVAAGGLPDTLQCLADKDYFRSPEALWWRL